jgi:hypothetical protein
MTDSRRCSQVRDLAVEVALGVATVEDRVLVLGHATTCADCRTHLAELSTLVDDLLTLVPPAEPPTGFESAVLARYDEGATAGPARQLGRRRVFGLAAALLLVASGSGGAAYWSGGDDRQLADGLRDTLRTANGQYFVAFGLRDLGGTQRGAVFAYQGNQPWLFITVDEPLPPGRYSVELVLRDGSTRRLVTGLDLSRSRGWGAPIPVAVHDAVLLRVLDADGRLVLTARLTRR